MPQVQEHHFQSHASLTRRGREEVGCEKSIPASMFRLCENNSIRDGCLRW